MKAKDGVILKAIIPYSSISTKCYREDFAHSIALLCYKLYDVSHILYMYYWICNIIIVVLVELHKDIIF